MIAVEAPLAGTRETGPRGARARSDAIVKQAVDVVAAAILLTLLSPIFLLAAIAIALESPGGVFYRAERVGYRGRPLRMLKFRKMRADAAGPALTTACDPRFTRVGSLLARTKLDELPQLWNVLRGEMSLVGPRPEDPRFVALEAEAYAEITSVKPGITGLCQLAFAREPEIPAPGEDRIEYYVRRLLPQKAALDRLYARNRSLLTDFRILFWTTMTVLFRVDIAVNRENGLITLRRSPGTHVPAPAIERRRTNER